MDDLRLAVERVFKGSVKSFNRFPAAIISAIVISIVAIIRVSMDWDVQQEYSLLFDSIQMSFLLGAVFSMAAVSLNEIRSEDKGSFFLAANISGILLAIISFLLLYFFGGITAIDEDIFYLSAIATSRVVAAIFVSIVAFIYISSKSKAIDDFSDSLFITEKAFVVSSIYGLVIMIGVSGVIGAFQALVYRDMSYNIYQYLAIAVGFLTFTIFLGYFPDFRQNENTDEINMMKEQPRFIFVLFGYILVPIMLALTVVLVLWSLRVILSGMDVSFNRLSTIAVSYVVIGIWLHMMVSKHNTKLTSFYRRTYPFAAVLILVFEAWALFVQLSKFGLMISEYSFFMIWIFAAISVVFLIFWEDKAYKNIALTSIAIAIIWVLPVIGYQDITFNSQVKRLERILTEEKILVNEKIVLADEQIQRVKKGEITEAVDFISYSEKTNTPKWYKDDLNESEVFKETFGFEKTYGVYPEPSEYRSSNFKLITEAIDISGYSLSLNMIANEKVDLSTVFEGENGDYEVMWIRENSGIPRITVRNEGNTIIDQSLEDYLSKLLQKYPADVNTINELPLEDMSLVLEGEGISLILVFSSIDIYFEELEERTDSYINLQGIYIKQ